MSADKKTEQAPPEPVDNYQLTAADCLVICYALGRLHASPFQEHAVRVAKKFGVQFADNYPPQI